LAALHEEYAKRHRIDVAAPVTARAEVVIEAPTKVIWSNLVDVMDWPNHLEPNVRNIWLPRGVTVDAGFSRTIKGARLRARFAVVDSGRELAWTGTSLGIKVVHRFVLEPDGLVRTRVFVEESMAGPPMIVLINSAKLAEELRGSLAALRLVSEADCDLDEATA
jgi:hypothetical protein